MLSSFELGAFSVRPKFAIRFLPSLSPRSRRCPRFGIRRRRCGDGVEQVFATLFGGTGTAIVSLAFGGNREEWSCAH